MVIKSPQVAISYLNWVLTTVQEVLGYLCKDEDQPYQKYVLVLIVS